MDTRLHQAEDEVPHGYEVVGALGRGAMSLVLLVRHIKLDQTRALKIMGDALGPQASPMYFEREQRLAARLGGEHRNIINVFDYGHLRPSGRSYAITQHYELGSLAESPVAHSESWEEVRARCAILAGVASALAHLAGAAGGPFVHRDVKPANILLSKEAGSDLPTGILGDFGLARAMDDHSLSVGGARKFPLAYSAPEIYRGERATTQSDSYSFAVTAQEVLVGALPFDARTQDEWAAAHLAGRPQVFEPNIQPLVPVAAAIEAGLAKSPSSRPTGAQWHEVLTTAVRRLA